MENFIFYVFTIFDVSNDKTYFTEVSINAYSFSTIICFYDLDVGNCLNSSTLIKTKNYTHSNYY